MQNKFFGKIPFLNKISGETRNKRNVLQHNKGYIKQTYTQHHSKWGKMKTFSIKLRTKQVCSFSPLLFNRVLELLVKAIRQEEIKGVQIGKGKVKLSLFADDMILYLKGPKNFAKTHLDIMNTFVKLGKYKINIQK
jgi:hypothetical protein